MQFTSFLSMGRIQHTVFVVSGVSFGFQSYRPSPTEFLSFSIYLFSILLHSPICCLFLLVNLWLITSTNNLFSNILGLWQHFTCLIEHLTVSYPLFIIAGMMLTSLHLQQSVVDTSHILVVVIIPKDSNLASKTTVSPKRSLLDLIHLKVKFQQHFRWTRRRDYGWIHYSASGWKLNFEKRSVFQTAFLCLPLQTK